MLTKPRWEAEVRLMRKVFPQFVPFAAPGVEAGFLGYVVGPRTGTPYEVTVKTSLSCYPEQEPGVYMNPHPESHHWIHDNRLCYRREGHVWNPAEDTFAQAMALAAKYIAQFDERRRE
jgi:hypothetical protein